jgi:ectoine hydroxylase
MTITQHELDSYFKNGFLVQPELLSSQATQNLVDSLNECAKSPQPGHVMEKDHITYRAFHGCHLYNGTYDALIRQPEMLEPARQILKEGVYIHQLKVNLKQAFSGEMWPWHQDYIYWRNEDKIPTNAMVSVMIFLDDITEFNGPLYFIPESHNAGCIDSQKASDAPEGWEGNVSASLTYQVSEAHITALVEQGGLFSAKGKKGTAIWFNGNLVHASPPNISPFQRRIVILTYNAVSNVPQNVGISPRPEFLCAIDRQALTTRETSILSS